MTMKNSPFRNFGFSRARHLFSSALAALLVISTHAADLVTWNVSTQPGGTNNFGTSPLAPTTSDTNLTIGSLTRGSGVGTTGSGAARGWGGNTWNVADASAAVTASKFATFTVTPNAGFKVSVSGISKFDYRRSGTGATAGELQVDVGGGGFATVSALSYTVSTSGGGSIAPIDLSGVSALQNVTPGTPITFRIVNFAASAATGTWYIFDVANSTASDFTVTGTVEPFTNDPDLTVTKTHTDTFTQGDTGRTYTLTVTNSGVSPTTGTVTLTDTLPAGLTATAMSGTGWTIDLPNKTATRSDALAAGSSYDPVTLTVNVSGGAPASVTNVATVSGGGETNTANNTASDPTTILSSTPSLTIFTDFDSLPENGGTVTATVSRRRPCPHGKPEQQRYLRGYCPRHRHHPRK